MSSKKSTTTNKPHKRKNLNVAFVDYIAHNEVSMDDICRSAVENGWITSTISDNETDVALTLDQFETLQNEVFEYNNHASSHWITVAHKVHLKYDERDKQRRRPSAVVFFELRCVRHDTVPMEEVNKILKILAKYSDTPDDVEKAIEIFIAEFMRDNDAITSLKRDQHNDYKQKK